VGSKLSLRRETGRKNPSYIRWDNPFSDGEEFMFYVVLIIIAALLAVALFYMRGRSSA
jgi:hypothetical protein